MEIIKIDSKISQKEMINQAVMILKNGGVIAYPTDTTYGLGVDATNVNAISKVYKIKGRDFRKPIHVVVSDIKMAKKFAYIDKKTMVFFKKFLPGPLTLVLKKKKTVLDELTANLKTVGIRIPESKIAIEIVKKFKKPVTTTSANLSGLPACYSLKEILKQFENSKLINLILDAGDLPKIPPSTIIDLTGKKPKVLREGPITSNKLIQEFERNKK